MVESLSPRRVPSRRNALDSDSVRRVFQATFGRWHAAEGSAHTPEEWYAILAEALIQECASLQELVALAGFAFVERITHFTAEAQDALLGAGAQPVLRHCLGSLTEEALATPKAAADYFQTLRQRFRQTGLRGTQVMMPIRAALTGTLKGPCLGKVASLLGLRRCRARLERILI
jgi:nondiscriminating glutamyl-tRNA synthetase